MVLKAQVAPLRRDFRAEFPVSEGWGAGSVVTPQTFEEAEKLTQVTMTLADAAGGPVGAAPTRRRRFRHVSAARGSADEEMRAAA